METKGRKKGDRVTKSVTFRCDTFLLERLAALSEETGISQSQFLINFLDVGLDLAESPPVRAAFVLRKWSDTFKEFVHGACFKEETRTA